MTRQNAQSAVDFSQALLLEVKDGTQTLKMLVEERDRAAWERNWDTTIASSVIEGFDMAIDQLRQPQQ